MPLSYTYKFFTLAVVILTFTQNGFSQPDSCFQAVNLTLCTPVTVSNASATATGDDTYTTGDICAASLDRTLWFAFTAPSAGMYEVLISTTSCTGAGLMEAGVLTGSCGGVFTSVACQSGAPIAPVVFTAATMQQFYIVVDGNTTDSCSFSIEVCQHCNAAFTPSLIAGAWPLPVNFTNTSVGALTYQWGFGFIGGTSTDSDPTITYDNPGTYTVTLTASNTNCSDTATAVITVSGASSMVVHNVFSPNNDGLNDFWKPETHGIVNLSGKVFNRFGEIVHTWQGVNGGWDGHTFPAGVAVSQGIYYYVINAEGYDGQIFETSGTVTVFR